MKQNLEWNGTGSTILYSIHSNALYYYESYAEDVHNVYGGKNYYRSRSGYSGAGYIEKNLDVLTLGYYRPNVKQENGWYEREYPYQGCLVTIFLPIVPHTKEGFNWLAPIVVRIRYNENEMDLEPFLYFKVWGEEPDLEDVINEAFQEFKKDNNKVIEIPFEYQRQDAENFFALAQEKFEITVSGEYHGYDLLRFIHYQPWRSSFNKNFKINYVSELYSILKIEKITVGRDMLYIWYDNHGLIMGHSKQDPLFTSIHINGINVATWEPFPQSKMAEKNINKKYNWIAIHGNIVRLFAYCKIGNEIKEYESRYTLLEFALNRSAAMTETKKALINKIREEMKGRKKEQANNQIIAQIPGDRIVTIGDSLSAGNCRPGTEEFRNRYFPNRDSVTVEELRKHLNVYGVKQVLLHLAP